ncbi:MAG: hypothetical protein Q9209_001189 [Squamulea sp. 1 TL-2023]
MKLRNGRRITSPEPPATETAKRQPRQSRGKGQKPEGVKKATAPKGGANPQTNRQLAQAAKKARLQKLKDAAGRRKQSKALGGPKKRIRKDNEPRDSVPKTHHSRQRYNRNGSNSSFTLSSHDSSDSENKNENEKKSTIEFWLRPYLKKHTPYNPRATRASGVQKVKKSKFPPFGKPFWLQSRRGERLELLLPILVTEEQKGNIKFRAKYHGTMGKIVDYLGEEGGEEEDDDDDDEDDDEEDGDETRGEGSSVGKYGVDNGGDRPRLSSGNARPDVGGSKRNPIDLAPEEDETDDNDIGRQDDDDGAAAQEAAGLRGDEQGDLNSLKSSDSKLPPYSTDYPLDPERRIMPPPRNIKPRSYDVVELGPDLDGLDEEPQMDDAAFLKSHHGYEEGWVGKRILGSGVEGRAGLWQKLDPNGAVINHICIKQRKNLHDHRLRKPAEAKIMEDLRDRPNNGSVRLIGYRRYPKIMAHRLYMEFCQYGDLESLIIRYRRKK